MAYVPSTDNKIVINNVDRDLYAEIEVETDPYQKFQESGSF